MSLSPWSHSESLESPNGEHLAQIEIAHEIAMGALVIVHVGLRRHQATPGTYRVLELESFSGGVVRGIDSPIHNSKPLAVSTSGLIW